MHILIVEDDTEIANDLIEGLGANHFDCTHVTNGHEGLILALENQYDVIITDLMLPQMDGLQMISELRRRNIQMPVLILTAKRSLDDRVLGLQNGGDDYLVKPYAFVELLARVNNLIRRSNKASTPTENTEIVFHDFKLSLISRELIRENIKISLQTKEYQLLEFFMKNPRTPLSK
ncbi:MAG: response regulator transcription factor, partial [Moraxellaceae bacterium]|nr:response regulator transcription factor [Pseudobdellovibrionaceae bacterium]